MQIRERCKIRDDGNIREINQDTHNVLKSQYELVDDLHYCFEDVVNSNKIFFTTLRMNKKQKVIKVSKTYL